MLTRWLGRRAAADLGSLLSRALECVRQGDAAGARAAAEAALALRPGHADALYLRGLAEAADGGHAEALEWFARARRANPANPAFPFSEGASAHALGRPDQAIAAWREAARLDPGDPSALDALGNALLETGEPSEAVRCLGAAVALSPEDPQLRFHLGNALRAIGDDHAAGHSFARAAALAPGDARFHNNLGVALHAQSRHAQALEAFDRAAALQPDWSDAHNNRGSALQGMERTEEALEAFGRALQIDPGLARARANRAQALQETGRWREALDEYAVAAAAGAAGARFRHALVLPVIPQCAGEIAEARGRIGPSLDALEADGVRLRSPETEVGTTGFHLAYHGLCNRDLQSRIARAYLAASPSLTWTAPHVGRTRRGGRLRIGFLSRFLRAHSIGKTSRGLIARFSRQDFEVIAIHVPPVSDDEVAQAIRASADRNVVIPTRLQPAREALAALELDALFYQDIGMDPFTYLLAFSRLAPVQCVSFGHPDTTGIPAMDWFVSSALYETAEGPSHYSERLWLARDAGTLAWYLRPPAPRNGLDRASLGLPPDRALYFCPHTHFRLHPEFDTLLRGILETDPRGEVLLIESRQPNWNRLLLARLARSLGPHASRVRMLPLQPHPRYLALMALCDAVLDPIHFNGMNNSLDAFAAGVPVVTWPRELQRGRHTTGMYRRMGWLDCVAQDAEQYVQLAVRLANDADFRASARGAVAERAGVLYEDDHVVREFERFFREACAG